MLNRIVLRCVWSKKSNKMPIVIFIVENKVLSKEKEYNMKI